MTTFADVQAILNRIADASDRMVRIGIFGRHNPLSGGFSWDSEDAFLHSVVNRPPNYVNVRIVDPTQNYAAMTSDADVVSKCRVLRMLAWPADGSDPAMPRMKAGTNRSYVTDDDMKTLIAYIRSLPFPRT